MNDERDLGVRLERWLETREAPVVTARLSENILAAVATIPQERRLRRLPLPMPQRGTVRLLAAATLLVAVAGRIRGCLRGSDTAARPGGDEFVVVLERVEGEGEALALSERITRALGEPFSVGGPRGRWRPASGWH